MIKLLLVDDQAAVRQGLRMRLALEPDVTVIGEAGDGAAALALARDQRPDVVLMDLEMPVMDGFAATAALRASDSPSAVVVLSLHDDAVTKAKARAAGAVAFVSKREASEELVAAIRHAAAW